MLISFSKESKIPRKTIFSLNSIFLYFSNEFSLKVHMAAGQLKGSSCLKTKYFLNEKRSREKRKINFCVNATMRWYSKLFVLSLALVIVYATVFRRFSNADHLKIRQKPHHIKHASEVTISAVVCGESRTDEIFTMIKSALVFSTPNYPLKFLIASEKQLFQILREKLESFQSFKSFDFVLREIKFPEQNSEVWRKLFKLCASQRLFLPSLFHEVNEAVLYVDSDTIFLSPPQDVFGLLKQFNSSHIAGLAQESENKNTGWYSRQELLISL